MKVGSLVYATDQGLGILAKSFYDAGVVTDALVIEHAHHATHREWYPRSMSVPIRPWDMQAAQQFCARMDVMLFFETPFDWSLLEFCRGKGIRTVVMPMYECMPRNLPALPDLWLCPSLLDHREFPDNSCYLPVPVSGVTWRRRERARVFVHNAGHGGLRGRNGTRELLDAWKVVKSPARLIFRTQGPCPDQIWVLDKENVSKQLDFRPGKTAYEQLYEEGDVFLFPEKFNGLSLPLQEAFASGMLVMATDRFPNTEYLPINPLIPVKSYERTAISGAYREFDSAVVDPKDIAAMVDGWYDRDIGEYSEMGREFNEARQWGVLRPAYMDVLENL